MQRSAQATKAAARDAPSLGGDARALVSAPISPCCRGEHTVLDFVRNHAKQQGDHVDDWYNRCEEHQGECHRQSWRIREAAVQIHRRHACHQQLNGRSEQVRPARTKGEHLRCAALPPASRFDSIRDSSRSLSQLDSSRELSREWSGMEWSGMEWSGVGLKGNIFVGGACTCPATSERRYPTSSTQAALHLQLHQHAGRWWVAS